SRVHVMSSVLYIKVLDRFRRVRQDFFLPIPKICQNEPFIALDCSLQEGHSTGVSQPAPLIDNRSFLAKTIHDPCWWWSPRDVGILQEVLYVLAAVQAQRVLNTVHV